MGNWYPGTNWKRQLYGQQKNKGRNARLIKKINEDARKRQESGEKVCMLPIIVIICEGIVLIMLFL